jgi:hypothetical protein
MKFLFQQLARKKNDRGQKIVYNFEHETISYAEDGERWGARRRQEMERDEEK